MLSAKIKDGKLRKQFFLLEKKLKAHKFLICNLLSNPNKMFTHSSLIYSQISKTKIAKRISKIKLRNRCISSNRGKGTLRAYSLSRIVMREYLQFGIIPGFKKSVW
jgi:ribosomal protein S14